MLRASGYGISAVAWSRRNARRAPLARTRPSRRALCVRKPGRLAAQRRQEDRWWDVGYAFRPNDVVEQEPRRLLLETTPEGRPLVSAERFDANTAWAFVLVNPTHSRSARFAEEPAFAARVYRRDGAVDWHGFARIGGRTGASVGAAAAWVATESIELHASARYLQRADSLALDGDAVAAAPLGLVRADRGRIDLATRRQALVAAPTSAEHLSPSPRHGGGTALDNGHVMPGTRAAGPLPRSSPRRCRARHRPTSPGRAARWGVDHLRAPNCLRVQLAARQGQPARHALHAGDAGQVAPRRRLQGQCSRRRLRPKLRRPSGGCSRRCDERIVFSLDLGVLRLSARAADRSASSVRRWRASGSTAFDCDGNSSRGWPRLGLAFSNDPRLANTDRRSRECRDALATVVRPVSPTHPPLEALSPISVVSCIAMPRRALTSFPGVRDCPITASARLDARRDEVAVVDW